MTSGVLKDSFSYLSEDDIYLDSGCQTLRPTPVIDAVDEYYRQFNACGGRVHYEWGRKVDEAVQQTRQAVLKFAGKLDKDYVCAFTLNTTYGINLILSQLPTDKYQRIVTSEIEHNSVMVPSISYSQKYGWQHLVLPRSTGGSLLYKPENLQDAVVILNTTSNFDGRHLTNAEDLISAAHKARGIVIFDAAQTMAHHPQMLLDLDFDALCFSAHKFYAPSLGVIVIKKQLLDSLELTFLGGGTVTDVEEDSYELHSGSADVLEPGLQNYSGIIGLGAALKWLNSLDDPESYEAKLAEQLYAGIKDIPGLEVINQFPSSIVSFYKAGVDAHELAAQLSDQNVMVRSGYFCCHYYLEETKNYPRLLRFSLGLNNTSVQVNAAVAALRKIVTK